MSVLSLGFTLWTCMCEGSAESKHFSERTSWLLCSMFSFMTGKCQYVLYMLGTFSKGFLWRRFTFSAQETLQFIFIGCESSRHPRNSQVCSQVVKSPLSLDSDSRHTRGWLMARCTLTTVISKAKHHQRAIVDFERLSSAALTNCLHAIN